MIVTFPNKGVAQKLGHFSNWTRIIVQVRENIAIRLGLQKNELESQAPGGIDQGLSILPSGGEPRQLWWRGDLWGVGDGDDAKADFQFMS